MKSNKPMNFKYTTVYWNKRIFVVIFIFLVSLICFYHSHLLFTQSVETKLQTDQVLQAVSGNNLKRTNAKLDKALETIFSANNYSILSIKDYFHENSSAISKTKDKKKLQRIIGKLMKNFVFNENGLDRDHVIPATNVNNNNYIESGQKTPVVINVNFINNNDNITFGKAVPTAINFVEKKVSTENTTSNEYLDPKEIFATAKIPSHKVRNIYTGIQRFLDVSCEPLFPKVLLYNRIFKTGSSSIEKYMSVIANNSNYPVFVGHTEDWYDEYTGYHYPESLEYEVQKSHKAAFVAHFYFRRKLDIDRNFTYINILRHPVSRIVSHYYYMRTEELRPKHRVKELKLSGHWDESLYTCLTHQHRGCEDNVMTHFFCGVHTYCKTGSNKALKLAKFNMKRYYASIGIYEKLELSLRLLRKKLPGFFLSDTNGNIKLPRIKVNLSKPKSSVNETIASYILQRNQADLKLYEYALKRFNREVKACSL